MPEFLQIVRFLGETRLCEGLDPNSLATLARAAGYREVKTGELMFQQGSAVDGLYLLRLGRVKLVQGTPDRGQVLLRLVSPGDTFGSAGIEPDQAYPVSAVSVRWCQLVSWNRKVVVELMQSYPRLTLNVLRELNAEIQELCLRYSELATEGVEQRLAQLLVRLAIKFGRKTDDTLEIDSLSRRDLAEMTGTTLYTVSRILSAWKRAGSVDMGRQWVAIPRPQSLAATAAQGPDQAVRRGNGRRPSRAVAA